MIASPAPTTAAEVLRLARSLGACRACGAPIRWVATPSSPVVALDREPSARGRWMVDPATLRAAAVDPGWTGERFTAHAPSCARPPGRRTAPPAGARPAAAGLDVGPAQPVPLRQVVGKDGRMEEAHWGPFWTPS